MERPSVIAVTVRLNVAAAWRSAGWPVMIVGEENDPAFYIILRSKKVQGRSLTDEEYDRVQLYIHTITSLGEE